MENYIKILYKKFLYGNITHDEFMEMRHAVNNTKEKDLTELLHEEWNDNIISYKMEKEAKEDIRDLCCKLQQLLYQFL